MREKKTEYNTVNMIKQNQLESNQARLSQIESNMFRKSLCKWNWFQKSHLEPHSVVKGLEKSKTSYKIL